MLFKWLEQSSTVDISLSEQLLLHPVWICCLAEINPVVLYLDIAQRLLNFRSFNRDHRAFFPSGTGRSEVHKVRGIGRVTLDCLEFSLASLQQFWCDTFRITYQGISEVSSKSGRWQKSKWAIFEKDSSAMLPNVTGKCSWTIKAEAPILFCRVTFLTPLIKHRLIYFPRQLRVNCSGLNKLEFSVF